MNIHSITIMFALPEHTHYAERICTLIYESALQRGTGIAKRSPEYISTKITGGKAVVALDGDKLVGFSYIECWGHGDFVATSGLIVDPEYRHSGLAAQIKAKTFELARKRFPYAKIFSITTSLPVMKLNSRLGYKPVTFSEFAKYFAVTFAGGLASAAKNGFTASRITPILRNISWIRCAALRGKRNTFPRGI